MVYLMSYLIKNVMCVRYLQLAQVALTFPALLSVQEDQQFLFALLFQQDLVDHPDPKQKIF